LPDFIYARPYRGANENNHWPLILVQQSIAQLGTVAPSPPTRQGAQSVKKMQNALKGALAVLVVVAAWALSVDRARPGNDSAPPAKDAGVQQAADNSKGPGVPPKAKNPTLAAVEPKAKELPRKIKVFRLKHLQPDNVEQLLSELLAAGIAAAPGGIKGGSGAPAGLGIGGGALGAPGGGAFGALGGPGMPGAGNLGVGGGLAGIGGLGGALGALGGLGGLIGGAGGAATWRIAVDPRSRALIVRGTESDLKLAADLVAVLDLPPGQAMPKVKSLRAYPLKFAQADALTEIIGALDLDARVVAVTEKNTLIAAGPESVMDEIGEVVKELDVKATGPNEPGM
jgi:type II secretory pathway component GspD/PulD (secretin)